MALIQTVNPSDLYHLACRMNRGDNYGYDGWRAIGDYLEEISNDLGENIDIDIISICCEYGKAESVEDFANQYPQFMDEIDPEAWGDMTEQEKLDCVAEFIADNGSLVICRDDLIIWSGF